MDGSASHLGRMTGASRSDVSDAPAFARPFLRRLSSLWRYGTMAVTLPDGTQMTIGGDDGAIGEGPQAVWTLTRWRAFLRLLTRGDIGFAEGYMAGEWDTPDLTALLTAFALNYDALDQIMSGVPMLRGVNAIVHALQRNSRTGSRRNIMSHYDLGNDFYAQWLDPSMTYSAALFDPPTLSLPEAQTRKYEALARSISIERDHEVLEIGCGWGGFSAYAAGTLGARVTAITLSPSQAEVARKRIFEQGLSERVDVQLIDYRDVQGCYDRIASIEMFEAVGEAYWPTYFDRVHDLLKPDGRAGLQIITIDDALFDSYRKRPDFIQLHVFPGGMLPSEPALWATIGKAGLTGEVTQRFGQDYGRTLGLWLRAFDDVWPRIEPLGYDARFRRLWRYYLAYCEAGFGTGRTDVVQLALSKV